jgi:hypothetical protein
MKTKYDIILVAEESFARAVAIGISIKKPLSVWHYLIPGIFIFDFLKRTSETRSYTEHFLFPRRLAIVVAQDIKNGEDRKNRLSRVEEEIKKWLNSLRLYSQRLHQGKMDEVNLLIDHYSKLLNADGEGYDSLIKNAYKNQEDYEAYLNQLVSVEKEVDGAIVEILGPSESLREKLLAKQAQLEELRKKKVDGIFSEAR